MHLRPCWDGASSPGPAGTGAAAHPVVVKTFGRLAAATDAAATWPVYTLEQVAEHNHKGDCWIVDDKVYATPPCATAGVGSGGRYRRPRHPLRHERRLPISTRRDASGPGAGAFQSGVLDRLNADRKKISYYTWEQLVASGCIGDYPGMRAAAAAAPIGVRSR